MRFSIRRVITGVNIGSSSLKIAGIRSGKRPRVEFFEVVDYMESGLISKLQDMNSSILGNFLSQLKEKYKIGKRGINLSISGNGIRIFNLMLPKIPEKDIPGVVKWEVKPLIPWDIEHCEIDFFICKNNTKEDEKIPVISAILEKVEFEKYDGIFKRSGISLSTMEPEPLAVHNCFNLLNGEIQDQPFLLLNLGAKETQGIIMGREMVPVFRKINFGGILINEVFEKTLNISYMQAEKIKREVINESFQMSGELVRELKSRIDVQESAIHKLGSEINRILKQFITEIDSIFKYFETRGNGGKISNIYLTGGTAGWKPLRISIEKLFKIPVDIWNPLEHLDVKSDAVKMGNIEEEGIRLAGPIGTVLRELE